MSKSWGRARRCFSAVRVAINTQRHGCLSAGALGGVKDRQHSEGHGEAKRVARRDGGEAPDVISRAAPASTFRFVPPSPCRPKKTPPTARGEGVLYLVIRLVRLLVGPLQQRDALDPVGAGRLLKHRDGPRGDRVLPDRGARRDAVLGMDKPLWFYVRAVNHARAGRRRLPSALARKRTCVLISILEGPGVIFY